jgi:hypothetical protein
MNAIFVQVESHSKCMDFPAFRDDLRDQKIYDMNREVLGAETPAGGMIYRGCEVWESPKSLSV